MSGFMHSSGTYWPYSDTPIAPDFHLS
uniref:Uncharacterized protein n=1 Tax=Anguilla anguilla TaxID=7936 RepID=A0A0E9UZQ2_ANGAN